MRRIIYPPDTLVKFPSIMGDGSDGSVTISVNTTLTRDMYYENLTINEGIVLTCAGFKPYVRNVLKNRGTIRNNGTAASGITGGAGAPAGSLTSGGTGGNGGSGSYSDGSIGGSVVNALGGNGGAGGIGDFSNGGVAGSAVSPTSGFGSARDFVAALTGKTTGQPFIKGHFRVDLTANQNVNNNIWSPITFSTAVVDDGAIVLFTAFSSNHIVKRAGLYLVRAHLSFAANAVGLRGIKIQVNSADVAGGGYTTTPAATGISPLDFSIILKLTVNDIINILAFQTSGATLALSGLTADITRSSFSATLLSDDSVSFAGGAGGGGGGGRDFVTAGGGGGGGGTLLIAANIIDNAGGIIESLGGAGGNGVTGAAAGGGGGGGGLIVLVYSILNDGTISAAGGAGGLKGNGTASGEAGSIGQIVKVKAL